MIFSPCFQAFIGPDGDLGLINGVVNTLSGGFEPPSNMRLYTVPATNTTENVFFDDARFFSVLSLADTFSGGGNVYIFTDSIAVIQPNIRFYSGASLIGSIQMNSSFSVASSGLFFTIPVLPIQNLRITATLLVTGTPGSIITLGLLKARI